MLTKNWTLKCCLLILFLSALLVVLAAGSGEAEGKTLTVDDDGGADYEKIQDAIDNATEGDVIRVWEGTYDENVVVVDKSMSLIGNESEDTIINGDGSNYGIYLNTISSSKINTVHLGTPST